MVLVVVLGGTGLFVGYPKDGSDHVLSGKTNGWLNFGEFRFWGWPWRSRVKSFFVSFRATIRIQKNHTATPARTKYKCNTSLFGYLFKNKCTVLSTIILLICTRDPGERNKRLKAVGINFRQYEANS